MSPERFARELDAWITRTPDDDREDEERDARRARLAEECADQSDEVQS